MRFTTDATTVRQAGTVRAYRPEAAEQKRAGRAFFNPYRSLHRMTRRRLHHPLRWSEGDHGSQFAPCTLRHPAFPWSEIDN